MWVPVPHGQLPAQQCEASMHSLGPFGCGQCWRNHRDIIPKGWDCPCYGFPTVIVDILYKSFLRKLNPHGEVRCAADRDRKITLASAVPLSVRELFNPEPHSAATVQLELLLVTVTTSLFLQSNLFIFSSFPQPRQCCSGHISPSVSLSYIFPFMWGDSSWDKGFCNLRWRVVAPLAVTNVLSMVRSSPCWGRTLLPDTWRDTVISSLARPRKV